MDTLESAGRKLRSESSASLSKTRKASAGALGPCRTESPCALEAGVVKGQTFPRENRGAMVGRGAGREEEKGMEGREGGRM